MSDTPDNRWTANHSSCASTSFYRPIWCAGNKTEILSQIFWI